MTIFDNISSGAYATDSMNFQEEFTQLLLTKPRYNVKQVNSENSEYADTAVKSRNCYYSFCVFYCEDVYYARYSRKCTSCSDITFCTDCQWCLACTDCVGCYMADYCQNCSSCTDCQYCKDCYSCENCFGCVGLHRKSYCIFNKQYNKEEYEKYLKSADLKEASVQDIISGKIKEIAKTPVLGIHQVNTEECVGDNLSNSKNCYQCYDAFNCEDCLYNIECNGNTDSTDLTVCFEAEQCYSCAQAPLNYNCNFLLHTDLCSDSEFCSYSKSLKHCFGCVYLAHKEYCILNKQYTKDEYFVKIAEIKQQLIADGKYNLSLYFVSDYEKMRLKNEVDSVIQTTIPTL